MPTLYFHAGMNKTGSTAIQQWLQRNNPKLAGAGLAFPILPTGNHSHFLQSQFGLNKDKESGRLMQRHSLSEKDLADFRTAFDRLLAASAVAGLDVVLSGEATMKLRHEGYTELRAFALQSFDRVVIVALVRPPLSFARSAMQQRLKGGLAMARFGERPPAPDYRHRFAPLIDVFGAENVRLRVFHRSTLVAGDVLQTVLGMLDGDRSALKDERAPRSNVAVSMTACKALALINGVVHAGRIGPDVPPPLAQRLSTGALAAFFAAANGRRVPQMPPHINAAVLGIESGSHALPHAIASSILTDCADDIAWMSERLGEDVLAYDDPLPPEGSDPFATFTEDEVATIAAAFDTINATDTEAIAALTERRHERRRNRAAKALKAAAKPPRKTR